MDGFALFASFVVKPYVGLTEIEEGFGVGGGSGREFGLAHCEGFGAAAGYVSDEGGLVGFAAVWLRCEVGAIGLQHEALDALLAECVADLGGVFIRDDAGERAAAAAFVDFGDFVGAVAVAVENDARPIDAGFVDHAEGVVEGVAAVDDDGHVEFAGDGKLLPEGGFLMEHELAGFDGVFGQVEVVEPDLSECDRCVGWHKECGELCDGVVPLGIDVARVEADGVVDLARVGCAHFAIGHPVFKPGANGDEALHASGCGAFEHRFEFALGLEAE